MGEEITLPSIKNIAVSGRIGSGATTLAKQLSEFLHWHFWEVGTLDEAFYKELGLNETDVHARPDEVDIKREEKIKNMFKNDTHTIIQSHLAGFNAQGISGVFKILVVCEDKNGKDKTDVRIDRLVNRKGISIEEGKREIKLREKGLLEKWRRLYANNNEQWVYWDKKYFDLIVNSYSHNKEESLQFALHALDVKQ